MKKLVITLLFAITTTPVLADEFIQFNDGSTAWRGKNGNIWGKTPSPSPNFDSNHSSKSRQQNPIIVQHGTTYVPAGDGYINTWNGQFVPGR